MDFFRHYLVRRTTLLLLLSWGVLTQVATVYACEAENGKKQISCCCENAINKDCKHQQSKTSNNKCDKSSNDLGENLNLDAPVPSASTCCEISYGATDTSIVSSGTLTAQQVVLLDAPQPPPLLPSSHYGLSFYRVSLPGQLATKFTLTTDTYLITQRLRI